MIKSMLFLLMLIGLVACTSNPQPDKPNVVFILVDDLGYGDLSCYGNGSIQTPNIDFLAAEGVKFIDFHSNGSVCSPTRAALLTGKYQQRTGISGVITAKSHRDVGLRLEEITIAEELKKYNYTCGMYGKWHLGYDSIFNPLAQGFDEYIGFVSGNIDYHAHIDQEGYLDWWNGQIIENEEGYSTDLITDHAVKFIEDNKPSVTKKPFFLYIAQEAPHYPYQRRNDSSLREIGKPGTISIPKDSIKDIYKEMVEVLDEGVGKIVTKLKEIGAYENTLILFMSDNGASKHGDNGVLRGTKGSVYEGGSRVPAILSYPALVEKGSINEQTILTMDVLPTILDFIGQKPSDSKVDGVSIKECLLYQRNLPQRAVFYAFKNQSFIRNGKWKLLKVKKQGVDRYELYDLSVDTSESDDLKDAQVERMQDMKERLLVWEEEVNKGVKEVSK